MEIFDALREIWRLTHTHRGWSEPSSAKRPSLFPSLTALDRHHCALKERANERTNEHHPEYSGHFHVSMPHSHLSWAKDHHIIMGMSCLLLLVAPSVGLLWDLMRPLKMSVQPRAKETRRWAYQESTTAHFKAPLKLKDKWKSLGLIN